MAEVSEIIIPFFQNISEKFTLDGQNPYFSKFVYGTDHTVVDAINALATVGNQFANVLAVAWDRTSETEAANDHYLKVTGVTYMILLRHTKENKQAKKQESDEIRGYIDARLRRVLTTQELGRCYFNFNGGLIIDLESFTKNNFVGKQRALDFVQPDPLTFDQTLWLP